MNIHRLRFYLIVFGWMVAGCSPEQKDADETLAITPPKQLTQAEREALADTSKCVFTTANGRITVTLDSNLNIIPAPRGYFDYDVDYLSAYRLSLIHSSLSSYDDECELAFDNKDGSSGLKAGVYSTSSYTYGNGRISITATYMYNGNWGERGMTPIGNQKIYVKDLNDGTGSKEVIFCNLKMKWEYLRTFSGMSYTTPITLNGKIRVN